MPKRLSAANIIAIAAINAFVGSLVANGLFISLGLTARLKLDIAALAVYAVSLIIHAGVFFAIGVLGLILVRRVIPEDRLGDKRTLYLLLGVGAIVFVAVSTFWDLWWLAFAFGPATLAMVFATFLMLKRTVRQLPGAPAS